VCVQSQAHIDGAREEACQFEEDRQQMQNSRLLTEQRRNIEQEKLKVCALCFCMCLVACINDCLCAAATVYVQWLSSG